MLKVTKFGGSSLCDSAGFARVREIVLADPARRVVVVSAAGKRHAADHKITDLLYLCHAHLQYGVSCWDLWRRVADRYREIRDGCALTLPIEAELEATPPWTAARRGTGSSRGRISLGAADGGPAGLRLRRRERPAAVRCGGPRAPGCVLCRAGLARRRAEDRDAGVLRRAAGWPDPYVPRGGSDVTGALAAVALHADLYENWTDVPGVLAADPRSCSARRRWSSCAMRSCRRSRASACRFCTRRRRAGAARADPAAHLQHTRAETPARSSAPSLSPACGRSVAGRRQLALLRLTGAEEGWRRFAARRRSRRFPAECLRRDGGHFADGTRLRGAAPPAGSRRSRRCSRSAARCGRSVLARCAAARRRSPRLCRRSSPAACRCTCCSSAANASSCSSTTASMSRRCAPPTPPAASCAIDKRNADMLQ